VVIVVQYVGFLLLFGWITVIENFTEIISFT